PGGIPGAGAQLGRLRHGRGGRALGRRIASVHPAIVDRVIFPLHERLKGKPTYARLHDLERSQWLEPGPLRELQFRAVRAHLEFAYAEVPYYTRLLDEHELNPRRIQSFEDFSRIPYLTRDLLRTHFEELQPRRR